MSCIIVVIVLKLKEEFLEEKANEKSGDGKGFDLLIKAYQAKGLPAQYSKKKLFSLSHLYLSSNYASSTLKLYQLYMALSWSVLTQDFNYIVLLWW